MRFNYKVFITDVVSFVLLYFLLLTITPLSTLVPYSKYFGVLSVYAVLVMLFCAFTGRYTKYLQQVGYRKSLIQYCSASAVSWLVVVLLCMYAVKGYSLAVVSAYMLVCILLNLFTQSVFFAYYYASDPETVEPPKNRQPQEMLQTKEKASESQYEAAVRRIKLHCTEKGASYLLVNFPIDRASTRVISCKTPEMADSLPEYKYNTIVDVYQLNNVRGINRLFCTINNKLPDNGIFVGCFTPKDYIKKRMLDKYPKGIRWVVYSLFYFYRRVIPKLFFTKRLYYDITKGKNRILSNAEVYGRLYYCGFEIVGEKRIDKRQFFVAKRVQNPPVKMKRRYGPIISLQRVGLNGRVFKFYKMRTMYPYSEFLQSYIYEHNNLQEGGKFRHDIRVNSVGRFMRKYWIDELPMIMNLIKGDIKLVGVRPLSKQYFSLYSPELQQKRTKYKPGLLPPFYVDMPKTLDEIQASEMKYLNMCEEKGVFKTDFIYFWRIVSTILFKHAHSK